MEGKETGRERNRAIGKRGRQEGRVRDREKKETEKRERGKERDAYIVFTLHPCYHHHTS